MTRADRANGRALMVQGTGSNVGKSLLVAGLCRAARKRGLSVAPFKPQNMSNNAAVTADGGEIGRAQALQALACGLAPHTDMNPILLKPETDSGAQIVVHGQRWSTVQARSYGEVKQELMSKVCESFARLRAAYDLVLVEGAGSPAEINLRKNDIANMGFARTADVPVVLAGDIDRGGVIAQIIGTQTVIDPADAAMIVGFLINKFRGDVSLFDDGYRHISDHTGWPGFGVVPHFPQAAYLPAEDALDIRNAPGNGAGARQIRIACPVLSRIANFDDLDPLMQEPQVEMLMIQPGTPIPGDVDLVILPGTKSTRGDLEFLRQQGWDIDLAAHLRRGGHVLGICGGYQMLGKSIDDPKGLEGPAGTTQGLGHLDINTIMSPEKRLTRVQATHTPTGLPVEGYEIHIGRSDGPDRARAFARINGTDEGAASADGRVWGSYLHGLFVNDAFRAGFLANLGAARTASPYAQRVEDTLDALADHLETYLDVDAMLACAR